jgi:hypothetical protein
MERTMNWPPRAALVVFIVSLAPGCSSRQLYGTGQAWQRNECRKIPDEQERSRCLSSTSTSYEDYKRQSEAARSGK